MYKIVYTNIVRLYRFHDIVNYQTDFRSVRCRCYRGPSCIFWYKKDIFHGICIYIILKTIAFFHQFLISFIKCC